MWCKWYGDHELCNCKGWNTRETREWNKCRYNCHKAYPPERSISLLRVAEIKSLRNFFNTCLLESREWYKCRYNLVYFWKSVSTWENYITIESRWDKISAKTQGSMLSQTLGWSVSTAVSFYVTDVVWHKSQKCPRVLLVACPRQKKIISTITSQTSTVISNIRSNCVHYLWRCFRHKCQNCQKTAKNWSRDINFTLWSHVYFSP